MTSSLTRSIDARDSVDITALLYEGAFNRSPEDAGLDGWVSALESGQLNAGGLAAAIVGSAEFAALHAGQDRAAIVNSFYLNVLGRAADQAGLDDWVNSGLSLGDILQGIALSPESLARNEAALHGYESAVTANALPGGAPQLETFAPPPVDSDLTVQTHSPLDPQFLNASGNPVSGRRHHNRRWLLDGGRSRQQRPALRRRGDASARRIPRSATRRRDTPR